MSEDIRDVEPEASDYPFVRTSEAPTLLEKIELLLQPQRRPHVTVKKQRDQVGTIPRKMSRPLRICSIPTSPAIFALAHRLELKYKVRRRLVVSSPVRQTERKVLNRPRFVEDNQQIAPLELRPIDRLFPQPNTHLPAGQSQDAVQCWHLTNATRAERNAIASEDPMSLVLEPLQPEIQALRVV